MGPEQWGLNRQRALLDNWSWKLAESKTLVVVPLNGGNYSTWKVQCRMALMKEGLWGLVNGTEAEPEAADRRAAYAARKDKALAIIVLAIETKLLHLVGDPVDPQVVREKLANQCQKKSWARTGRGKNVSSFIIMCCALLKECIGGITVGCFHFLEEEIIWKNQVWMNWTNQKQKQQPLI